MNFEGKQQSLLTFRIGPVLCCAPSLPVRSIIRPPTLTHPPGSNTSNPGFFKHGSHIIKVIDLRQKFGIEKNEQTQPGNLIITFFKEENFAFWVDQILDVFDFPSKGWSDLPAGIPRGVFSRTLLLQKKIYLYSEFEKLATIHDLGYLKQYIQQLKQQAPRIKKSIEENSNKKTSTTNIEVKIKPSADIKKPPSTKPLSSAKDKKTFTPLVPSDKSNVTAETLKPKESEHKSISTIKKTTVLDEKKAVITLASTLIKKHEDKKTIVEKKPTVAKKPTLISNKNKDISFYPMGIFILFIFMSLGIGLYYFIDEISPTNYKKDKSTLVKNHQQEINLKEKTLLEQKNIINNEQNHINDSLFVIEQPPSMSNGDSTIKNTFSNKINQPQPENNYISLKKEITVDEYRAEIHKNENEITITIHQPAEEAQRLQDKLLVNKQLADNVTIEYEPASTVANENHWDEITKKIKPTIVIKEIIHTVVKGDTLWAIAKKYVHNPFLYPELARLSNIKNPHRIYPGNRVRIRFIQDKSR